MLVAAYAFHEKKENDQHVREQGLLCLFLDWRENLAIPLQYVGPDSWFFECERPFINKPDGHNWVCCTKCTAVRPGLGRVLWEPSNPQHMLIKDLTPFMQGLSQVCQKQASERKALLAPGMVNVTITHLKGFTWKVLPGQANNCSW